MELVEAVEQPTMLGEQLCEVRLRIPSGLAMDLCPSRLRGLLALGVANLLAGRVNFQRRTDDLRLAEGVVSGRGRRRLTIGVLFGQERPWVVVSGHFWRVDGRAGAMGGRPACELDGFWVIHWS